MLLGRRFLCVRVLDFRRAVNGGRTIHLRAALRKFDPAFVNSANLKDVASFNEVVEAILRNLSMTLINKVQYVAKVDELYVVEVDDRLDAVAGFEKFLSRKGTKFGLSNIFFTRTA